MAAERRVWLVVMALQIQVAAVVAVLALELGAAAAQAAQVLLFLDYIRKVNDE
jgi:hypothetical protein